MCPQKSHQSFSVTKQDVENQDKVVTAKYLINNWRNLDNGGKFKKLGVIVAIEVRIQKQV